MAKTAKKEGAVKTAKKSRVKTALDEAAPSVKSKSKSANEKALSEKRTEILLEIRRKGMELLSGSETKVDSTIMIMTKEGWKSIKINRSKINY